MPPPLPRPRADARGGGQGGPESDAGASRGVAGRRGSRGELRITRDVELDLDLGNGAAGGGGGGRTSFDFQRAAGGSGRRAIERSELTVEEFVEAMPWGRFNWKVLFQCGACWACDAMEMMLVSFMVPIIEAYWLEGRSPRYRATVKGLVGALTFLGVWFGAMFFGWLGDKVGRRASYFGCTLMVGGFGIVSSFSNSPEVFLFLRFLVGLGLGGAPTAFTLFTEWTPSRFRGLALIVVQGGFWSCGAIYEAGIAWGFLSRPDPEAWRGFLVLSALPSCLMLLMFPWLPESPRYLLVAKKYDKLLALCKEAARANGVTLPADFSIARPRETPGGEVKKARFTDLFAPGMRLTTALLWVVWFSNVFCYYGLVFVTPQYFALASGNEYEAAFVTTLGEFPGLLVAAFLVDPLGRKGSQTALLLTCMLGSVGLCFTRLPFGLLTVFAVIARGAINGAFAITYVYTPEVYPTVVRALALGTCSGVGRIAGMITSFVSTDLDRLPAAAPLAMFAAFALASAVACHCLPIETKGREMADAIPGPKGGAYRTMEDEDAEDGEDPL